MVKTSKAQVNGYVEVKTKRRFKARSKASRKKTYPLFTYKGDKLVKIVAFSEANLRRQASKFSELAGLPKTCEFCMVWLQKNCDQCWKVLDKDRYEEYLSSLAMLREKKCLSKRDKHEMILSS